MKKIKNLAIGLLALSIGIGGVNAATASRSIDTTKCDTVYTNYYFFIQANPKGYFNNKDLNTIKSSNVAYFSNNTWRITDFDVNNMGYGVVDISHNSKTSNDGITSMSLTDFYTYTLQGFKSKTGSILEGNKSYIVTHKGYHTNSNGEATTSTGGLGIGNQSVNALVNASLDSNTRITLQDTINPTSPNPFKMLVERNYTGSLTGKPINEKNGEHYLQPSMYYIQYCSPKKEVQKYQVNYDGNGDNVTNVPATQTSEFDKCITISHAPTREGYEFLGWSRDSKATSGNPTYAVGMSYCGNENITLYAIWKKKDAPVTGTYTVVYKPNTSDSVNNMPNNSEVSIELDYTISNNIPVRPGYEFLGWHTDATADTGSDEFKGGSLYQDRKDLVLYAIWKKVDNNNPTPSDPTPSNPNPENPKTGVADYIIPASGTIGLSAAGLQVLKKKKTFRQF